MILSNFLSRQKHDDSNPHEIIPVLFNMQNLLLARYYNIDEDSSEGLVQTHSQVKSSEIKLPPVHGIGVLCSIRCERVNIPSWYK